LKRVIQKSFEPTTYIHLFPPKRSSLATDYLCKVLKRPSISGYDTLHVNIRSGPVDNAASTGAIIATCSNLEIAVAAADKASGYWPEITIQDDSGKELYRAPSKPAEEMKGEQGGGNSGRNQPKREPIEEPTPQVEGPVPVRITTIPTYRPKKKLPFPNIPQGNL
jgi:hypothetical protein